MNLPANAVAAAPWPFGPAAYGHSETTSRATVKAIEPAVTKIDPITKRGEPDVDMRLGMKPESFWRTAAVGAPDPANHAAPPSVMQIRISQLLDAQASELERKTEEAVRKALAEIEAKSGTTPAKPTGETSEAKNPDATGETEEFVEEEAPPPSPPQIDLGFSAYTEAKLIARSTVLSTFP